MKLLLSCFIFFFSVHLLSAQGVNSDTLPYKIGKYDIKKQEKVSALAQKLKVDPVILVKLNKFKSTQSSVVKGQRIKIPVYPKAAKTTDKKKPKKEEVQKVVPENKPKPVKPNSDDLKPVEPEQSSDREKDRVRLIFIDATLELNEAMMEGVKASLDAMDAKVEKTTNAKSVNTEAQKAKLSRDRTIQMPYILHIQDSLSKEIQVLRIEKKTLEERISPPQIRYDTVIVDNDIIIYETISYSDNRAEEKTIKQVIAREKKNRTPSIHDTVIVYNLSSGKEIVADIANTDLQSPDRKSVSSERSRNLAPIPNIRTDSSVALKIKIPNTNDSVMIKPILKPRTAVNTKNEIRNVKAPISSADSVKRIKAEFFLKRAQKEISGKNYKSAEEYLKKSIELYATYFDAWFALAQMDDRLGSLQSALKGYQMCAKIDSTQSKLYDNIGNVYLKMKQKNEALAAFNKAILLKPDDIPALMARAAIFTDWKKYNQAIADYDLVLKIDRIFHYAYKARGQVKLLTKDFSSAVDDFTRFLIFEETDPSAFFYRGLAKIGNNELLDGCLDLSTSAGMGYSAADKAIKKSCE